MGRSAAETVQNLMGHVGAGRVDEAAAHFADHVDFAIPHAPGIPWIPEVSTRDGMREFFTLLGRHLVTEEFAVDTTVADETDVLLVGRMRDTVVATGRSFQTPFVIRMSVHDGLVTRYHVFEDSHAVAQAYFDAPSDAP